MARRPKSWQLVRGTPAWRAWAGLAFEGLCLKHASAIERALGVSGVDTQVSGWLHQDAQVDLLIDRADGVLSVCEVKFTDEPFRITKDYADKLRRKLEVLRERTGTKKRFQLVFVTSAGVADGAYRDELVDAVVTVDQLLRGA